MIVIFLNFQEKSSKEEGLKKVYIVLFISFMLVSSGLGQTIPTGKLIGTITDKDGMLSLGYLFQ